MSADYVSGKQDGYLSNRNEVNRDREMKLQVREVEAQNACRNLPAMSKENYGRKLNK